MIDPIAFKVGAVQVHWYGIFVALAFLSGYFVTMKLAKGYGLNTETVEGLIFKLTLVVFIGARLAYVIDNWGYFRQYPVEIIRFDHGGLGSHGAIIAAMVAGYFWTRKARIDYWVLADAVAPVLPIGHIFVRLGNFFNGELYGKATDLPWGMIFPGSPGPVHPTQLYELALSLLILPLAFFWSKTPRYPGYSFLRVLFIHSIVRIWMDFTRENRTVLGPLALTQGIALAIAVAIFGVLWYLEYHKYPKTAR